MRACKHCEKFAAKYKNLIKTHYTWRIFQTSRGQVDHVVNVFGNPVCASQVRVCDDKTPSFGCALLKAGAVILAAALTLFYFSLKSDAERCFFEDTGGEMCRADDGSFQRVRPILNNRPLFNVHLFELRDEHDGQWQ